MVRAALELGRERSEVTRAFATVAVYVAVATAIAGTVFARRDMTS